MVYKEGSAAPAVSGPAHTYSDDCPHCGDGRAGTRCDLSTYSVRRVRFVLAHHEVFNAAFLNPSSAAASNELQRLQREWETLLPRHACTCQRLNPKTGVHEWHCYECRRLDKQRVGQVPDVAISIGRTSPVHAPMPTPLMLDLERAVAVVGATDNPAAIARYMSLNGHMTTAVTIPVEAAPAIDDVLPLVPLLEETGTCICLGFKLGGAAFCLHLTPAA